MPESTRTTTTQSQTKQWIIRLAACGCLLALVGRSVSLLLAQDKAAAVPATIVVEKDITYATIDGRELHLDLARPKTGDGPFPAVLCVHGGGWAAGDKTSMHQPMQNLAQQGYVAACVQYRLAPGARFPSQIQDVKAAVRYLRSHAKE